MTFVDWAVVIIMVGAVIAGMAQGFFRSACSFGGLVLGLGLAAWNYNRLAQMFLPVFRISAIANTVAFLLIALIVMVLAGLIGNMLSKATKKIGLGCLDSIVGAVFGFFQGVVLVCVLILVIVAFFPQEQWLAESTLPRMFFGALHVSTHVSPSDLAEKIRAGLHGLEHESERLLHSSHD